jgi:hypothetical protein
MMFVIGQATVLLFYIFLWETPIGLPWERRLPVGQKGIFSVNERIKWFVVF